MRYFLNRMTEPSTWASLASLAVLFGAPTTQVNAVVQLIGAAAAAVGVFTPEKK